MVKNLLRSAVLKLVFKLATDVDFTTASDRLFQTSTTGSDVFAVEKNHLSSTRA